MKSLSHKELSRVIQQAYDTKVALFIWGATGIGKSETVRASAVAQAKKEGLPFIEGFDEKSFGFIDVRLSQFDPSDLRGLPFVMKEGMTKWAFPNWLPTTGKGILFLDEANLAPPLVQSSAYQLILDRRLGDYVVPDGWTIIAAGNRSEDKGYTFELAGPLCNRFIHAELGVPHIDEWTDWASKAGIDPRIITFLNFKSKFLFAFDSKLKDKAFPTPRSWAKYCSPLIKDVDTYDMLNTMIGASVGEGVATECVAYLRLSAKIDLKALLAKPEDIEKVDAIDLKYSLVSALAEHSRKESKKSIPQVLKCLPHLPPEFGILLLRMMKSMHEKVLLDIALKPEFSKTLDKFLKFLQEA